ncbi:MAG TPA: tetratricopeptide repeat protein [Mucilaginibacter sp.]
MKYLFIIILASCTFSLHAQAPATGPLQFIDHAYDLEDHWVAFPKNIKTGKFPFGYIYLDTQAGFTFNLEGYFQLDAQGHAFRDSTDYLKNAMFKVRLGPNTSLVAMVTDNMLADFKVNPKPSWLAIYKSGNTDRNSVAMKVTIGKHLNTAGAPKKALEYLESAYTTDPHAAGLEFELSYSYNELGQYDKSIKILKDAVAYAPDNPMFYKELGFAYMHINDMDNAAKTFTDGIIVSKQHHMTELDELAYNLSYVYDKLKQYDKAISTLNNAIADLPGQLSLYIHLAVVYTTANDPDNAIKTYTTAIDKTPATQMEQRTQLAWSIALLYRDQKKDIALYSEWGKKAKEWAPVNSKGGQFLKNMVF